ncbi:hypothetical protein [Burkholderia ubonensis]|uniref:hypothetical protein n=1 Tax=Burkholderia ubonensis TaxID=101571 RepID=UPI0012F940FA|nr:hypothetical protein [Burkholderia ubonensis]
MSELGAAARSARRPIDVVARCANVTHRFPLPITIRRVGSAAYARAVILISSADKRIEYASLTGRDVRS